MKSTGSATGVAGSQPRYKAHKDVVKILNGMAGVLGRPRVEARLVYDDTGFRRYMVKRIHDEFGYTERIINNEIDKWVWNGSQ